MSLLAGIVGRQDKWGLVHPKPGVLSGNGQLYSAEGLLLLEVQGFRGPPIKKLQDDVLAGIEQCEIQPGFYHRHPVFFWGDQEGPDDAIGRALIYTLTNRPELALQEIAFWNQGWKLPRWPMALPCYCPNEAQYRTKFGWRAWHYKYFAMRANMYWAAGLDPSPQLRFMWDMAIETTGDFVWMGGSKHDPWILSWLSIHARKRSAAPTRQCQDEEAIFRRKLLAKFKGGMKQVFAEYFGGTLTPEYTHPYAEFCPE